MTYTAKKLADGINNLFAISDSTGTEIGKVAMPTGITDPAQAVEMWLAASDDLLRAAQSLAAYAAEMKWRKEIAGVVWNGWPVATDREASQPKVHATVTAISTGLRTDGKGWKFADGVYRPLTNEQAMDMAAAVFTHIEACFAMEESVLAAIANETITTTAEIDAAFAQI